MTIAQRIKVVRENMERAAVRAGRDPGEITLMGVSKFHPAEEVTEALAAGLSLFGENRVQEAGDKFKKDGPEKNGPENVRLELHLIGTLQRNKAKTAVEIFDCIQSLDRDELIDALGRLTENREKPLPVLLEMHTGEESKSGYPGEDSLFRAVEKIAFLKGLSLQGLMTMAPYTQDQQTIRKSFRTLAAAREKLRSRFTGLPMPVLSMGMSNDYEIAIEEGSTLVRIGTAIFGERRP